MPKMKQVFHKLAQDITIPEISRHAWINLRIETQFNEVRLLLFSVKTISQWMTLWEFTVTCAGIILTALTNNADANLILYYKGHSSNSVLIFPEAATGGVL